MTKLAPYLNRQLDSLTLDDLTLINNSLGLGLKLDGTAREAALALFQGTDVHTVADLLASPTGMEQLKGFVSDQTAKEEERGKTVVRQCRHCNNFNLIELE